MRRKLYRSYYITLIFYPKSKTAYLLIKNIVLRDLRIGKKTFNNILELCFVKQAKI